MSNDKGPTFRRRIADRDVRTEKHAVPTEVYDDPTGRCEGEVLARSRQRRPTPERVARLETKHDELDRTVARLDSKVDTLLNFAAKADAERERRSAADAERARLTAAATERALANRRKFVLGCISTLGVAVAAVLAALAGVFT